jgi:hypothetical protein
MKLFYSCVPFFFCLVVVGLLHKVIRDVNAIRTPKFNPTVVFLTQTFCIISVYIYILHFCGKVTTDHINISGIIK